jgi:hypothetical protein
MNSEEESVRKLAGGLGGGFGEVIEKGLRKDQ